MAAPPASTKTSLQQRLSARARERWPELAGVDVKFRGEFAYVTGRLKDGDTQPLMRLRYGGSAARWGFAIYLASKDGTKIRSCPPVSSPAPPRTPWTPPAGSTWVTPPPGPEPPTKLRI